MRINIDRLCELAGVPGSKRTRGSRMLYENKEEQFELNDLEGDDFSLEENPEGEVDPANEYIEVDEKDLVMELRRARVIMRNKQRKEAKRKQRLQEMHLKGIIDQEVKNVLKELQLTSGWMYGKKKPKRSRPGYTHQGTYLKGIGFK